MSFVTNGELAELVGIDPQTLSQIMYYIRPKFGIVKHGRRYYDLAEVDAIRAALRRAGKLPPLTKPIAEQGAA